MDKNKKPNWKEIIEKSNGELRMLPENLTDKAKAWKKKLDQLNEFLNKAARMEIETQQALNDVIYEVRKFISDAGDEEVWTKDCGFELSALRDGLFIITLRNNRPGQ